MATQTELAELKRAVQELNQKMDKQMVLVQGLVDLFTSVISKPDLGLVKEPLQARHTPVVRNKLCSKDMFKDLVEFHEARARPKEIAGSLFKASAEKEDICNKEIIPSAKRVHSLDSTMLYSGGVSKSSANPQSNRWNPPRAFSCFSTPLSTVYEKLLEAGFL
ncbi:hypothetical protein RHMOL_Rhmol05G0152400 [Rhododendron molle]|uniref:Uncharacterized protein n=1 Tax=Rhododendron molle TaxID=49168 RepID=A0ACC0NP37_RHOML|nr:hypothetical protein RHMOL_Rhmol05G0152400 [Rhododendron molle]